MRSLQTRTIDVVAGAGGAKGAAHIGAFRALENCRVSIGKLTGVSIGSLIATLYANGMRADDMEELFLAEKQILRESVLEQLKNPLTWLIRPFAPLGLIDLKPAYQELVRELGLKPRNNLRIMASDRTSRRPVVFEGTDYDLPTALAASCAVPVVMRSVQSSEGLLVDGAVHHAAPGYLAEGKAIVLKLLHGSLVERFQPDDPKDIIVKLGTDKVSVFSLKVSLDAFRHTVDAACEYTTAVLQGVIGAGDVPLLKVARKRAG